MRLFGPVNHSSHLVDYRPFLNAVIDGFDLDFENQQMRNLVPFASELRRLFLTDPSKTYLLTVAPQCPYPDRANNELLIGPVHIDAVFVQFYNNYCGVNHFSPLAHEQPDFNFDTWELWAKTISNNSDVKVFMGVLGSKGAAWLDLLWWCHGMGCQPGISQS
uniref:Chitinase 3 n=1 Tax=Talaromyces marneffei PM1 TaxID=1077442 RepID=A0A093X667_TALMA